MNCFPIAIQAPHEDVAFPELDLLAELADSVSELAGKLKAALSNKFSTKESATVSMRLQMAQNPQTSAALLRTLSRDASSTVRSQVIFNPSLDEDDLKRLANDSDSFVRSQARAQLSMAA